MAAVDHTGLKTYQVPGIRHRTLAGPEQGLKSLEVWEQTMASGGNTPEHRHPCEEVFVILQGAGRLTIEGNATDFAVGATLTVPPGRVHKVENLGSEDLVYLAILGMSPVTLESADGTPIQRPWLSNEPTV